MPYIDKHARDAIENGAVPGPVGELNYLVTRICDQWMRENGGLHYANLNAVVGVLECAKLEFYRRVAAPYEDIKLQQNGDVYD
jgi:hypothetical protein